MIRSTYPEGAVWITLARVVDPSGTALVYAAGGGEAVSIALKIYDVSLQDNVDRWAGGSITIGSVWFDTLLTTYGWGADAEGYNLRHLVSPGDVTGGCSGGHVYKLEYRVTTASFGVYVVEHAVTVSAGIGT